MKTIIITKEDTTRENIKANVSNNFYSFIQSLEYNGGFKRFGLSLYDENVKGTNDKNKVKAFLNTIFNNQL